MDISPAEGFIAVEFLDDDEDEDERAANRRSYPTVDDDYNEAVAAYVVGIGKKVTTCKKGDTVFVRKYARNAIHMGSTYFVEAYCVVATVKS